MTFIFIAGLVLGACITRIHAVHTIRQLREYGEYQAKLIKIHLNNVKDQASKTQM